MRLALIQMTSEKAAIDANVARMLRFLDVAAEREADLICFPEMNVTGYVMPRKFPDAVITWDHPSLEPLYRWSERSRATTVAGIVEHNPDGLPWISQAVIRDGQVAATYRKIHIVDDEALVFTPGEQVLVHRHGETCFGILVCADQARPDLFRRCAEQGARIVLLPSAPGLFGAQRNRSWPNGYHWWRQTMLDGIGVYAEELGMWIASTAQAGRTVDEDFPGGGFIFNDRGQLVAETPDWSEGMIIHDIESPLDESPRC